MLKIILSTAKKVLQMSKKSTGAAIVDAHSFRGLGFLSFVPPEIRDPIYHHVFPDRYCYSALSSPSIGLLRGSKTIRDEVAHIYSQSKFKVEFKNKPGMEKQTAFYMHVGKSQSDFDKNLGLR